MVGLVYLLCILYVYLAMRLFDASLVSGHDLLMSIGKTMKDQIQ